MNLKKFKRSMIYLVIPLSVFFTGCDKLELQKDAEYKTSFYDNTVNMSVMEFMESRPDMFSGMLSAIRYVDEDAAYKDVKEMYSSTGNTFLLLHDNALTNLEDANSYFVKNLVKDDDPASPTYGQNLRGGDWSQYGREAVANLLRYHVLKGTHDYQTLNSTPKWVDTFALNATNDSAKVYIYLQATRDGYLFINNYAGTPTVEIRPRTPDLHATNGVIQVMNRYFTQPTRQVIADNK